MSGNLLCKFLGHKFSKWEYVADNSCEQVRVCKRDGYEERRKVPHQFSEWEYVTDNSCEQIRVCTRDGYEQKRQAHHQFGAWTGDVRFCKRCGHEDRSRDNTSDDYDSWSTCPECGGSLRYVTSIPIGSQEGWIDECESCGKRYQKAC